MPKLTQKFPTFDHDDPQPPSNPTATEPDANRLSKLTLSSSLYQLSDSKYFQPNAHQCHPTATRPGAPADRAPPAPTPTSTSTPSTSNSTSAPAPTATQNPNANPNPNPNQPGQKPEFGSKQKPTPAPTPNQTRDDNATAADAQTAACPGQREAKLDAVHVVVGNESCDLDSVVSCLLMFHIISKMSDEINGKDKSSRTLYIPLLNTTRELLDTKSEVLWFLERTLSIDKTFLTCRDDIDWAEIKRNGVEVLVTLVDHNYNEDFDRIGRIVEIIDHHQVQNPQWLMELQANGLRLTLDTAVGSCSTLVAERLFYIYAEHHVSNEILTLIYGTVLLDTICLSETAKRFTRRDVYLLRKLDALLGPKRPARDQLYRQLVEVKNSTSCRGELDFERLMRRDLKVYKDRRNNRVGIASLFGMAAREALGLGAHSDLGQFLSQNQYAAFVIMGLIADPECPDSISRDLVLISADERLFGRLSEAFQSDASRLDLLPVAGQVGARCRPNDPEESEALRAAHEGAAARRSTAGLEQPAADKSPAQPKQQQQQPHQQPQPQQPKQPSQPACRTSVWQQRNVSSSRKVLAPLVLKVLHDGAD